MKRFLALALLLAVSTTAIAQTKSGLRVGTAAVNISPDVFPFQLRSGKSTYVHDPLHVRAVAFQNGEGRAVIALIDAIGYGREKSDEAKGIVAKRTGWKPEEMLLSATHTHTAPKGGDTSPGRIAYEKTRFDGIVAALTGAIESIQPANVGFSSDEEPTEVLNRRWHLKPGTMDKNPLGGFDTVRMNPPRDKIVSPAGPTDPEVGVIYACTKRGKPLGLIANYALHYVGGIPKVTEENGKVVGMASAGVPPRIMGIGPAPASKRLMERLGLSIGDIDVVELNEAFAAQGLAVMRELGLADDADHVNPNGGAIALGHPLGMSGARLALTAATELVNRDARRALCTMCIGVGQGIALILEKA